MQIYNQYMYSYPHKTNYKKLEGIFIRDYLHYLFENEPSMYIHIPFCSSKCGYCNLFSIVDTKMQDDYVNAVLEHAMQLEIEKYKFENIIIGGGTPLILSEKNLEKIFSLYDFKKVFSIIETSPKETSESKLNILKENSVNRISIGVQSFLDSELEILRRSHNTKEITNSLELIKKYKFEILNIDLIYGIPNQNMKNLKYSIEKALYYEPEEIFIYPLYIRKNAAIRYLSENENRYEMYNFLSEFLKMKGYFQNSMRSFTKKAKSENKSCGFENTISLGCGGRTYLGNLHFCAPYSNESEISKSLIQEFISAKDKTLITNGIILDGEMMKKRFLIKNLFYYKGLDSEEYEKHFNSDLFSDFPILHEWIKNNYAVFADNNYKLNDLGISYSDYLGPMI